MTGKGRGRGKKPTGEGTGPSYAQMGGGATAPPQPQAARPPAASAWGPPAGASARATHRPPQATPGDVAAQMQRVTLGEGAPASGRPAPPCGGAAAGNGNGNGNGGGAVGRGSVRGARRIDTQIIRTRPANLATKQGTDGAPVRLLANYFKINTVPDWALRQYRVDIAPEEDRTFLRKVLLGKHRELLGGYLFDGTVLYTTSPITSKQKPTLTLTSQDDKDPDQKIYTITIKEVGEVNKGDYAYIQIFNLLMRTCLGGLNLKLVGRDYYDAEARVEVPAYRLELWPGYKTSIRQHESDILMCVEITHKVMRMETALDILQSCYQRDKADYQRAFVKEIVGCIVLTKYNNKTYRIDDVDWNVSPNHSFDRNGKPTTYADYMREKYQISIKDMRQPMLVSRAKARDIRAGMQEIVNLIPEHCFCTGITDAMRSNMQLMRALAEHTRVAPDVRIQKLRTFNTRLQSNTKAIEQLKRFEMTLERDVLKLSGKVLPKEKILLGMGKIGDPGNEADWTRDLRNPLLNVKDLTNWVMIIPSKFKRDGIAFVEFLKKAVRSMRFPIEDPDIWDIGRDNAAEYAQALGQVMDQMQPQLIMCCVPNQRADRYAAIKKKCCVDRAVPTQVIMTKNLNDPKKTMSIATKVAIQMNCKIGGSPWSVELPVPGLMVVGFDVCHDTSSKAQSFGAMVASLDKAMSRYFSAVTPHNSGEELSNNLALNMMKALRKYQDCNGGTLPQRIILYRDGVGEGQVPFVISTELDLVKSKLAQAYGQNEPKFTFIIVTKRINTRLFTDAMRNPPPGCVVDDVVTDPEKYDFFLVSQSVRQGTVSPTSYNVIHDTVCLPAGRLQRMTYKMCHMYFNWSGTVRVPAPCQYAHKLAFLVGQALHREPSSQLEDLLYFL